MEREREREENKKIENPTINIRTLEVAKQISGAGIEIGVELG